MLEPLRRTFVKALKYVPSKNEFDSLVAEWNDGIAFVQKISDETRYKPAKVDSVPVVHGRWTYPIGMAWEYICSECGANGGCVRSNYCPHCGATMDAEVIAKNATTTKDGASNDVL